MMDLKNKLNMYKMSVLNNQELLKGLEELDNIELKGGGGDDDDVIIEEKKDDEDDDDDGLGDVESKYSSEDEYESINDSGGDDDSDNETDTSSVIATDKKKKIIETVPPLYKDYIPQDWINVNNNEYYKKISNSLNNDYLKINHPEVIVASDEEIENYCNMEHYTRIDLTKYEKARVIGIRATQIESGFPTFVDIPEGLETNPIAIAELELENKKIPFKIKRPFANGEFEYWRVSDLINF